MTSTQSNPYNRVTLGTLGRKYFRIQGTSGLGIDSRTDGRLTLPYRITEVLPGSSTTNKSDEPLGQFDPMIRMRAVNARPCRPINDK